MSVGAAPLSSSSTVAGHQPMKPRRHSDPVERTLDYYDSHAEEFLERTATVSIEHLYEPFLALVPQGGRILDAGCGSGRDAAEFARRGYEVVAFDGSAEIARLASERTGLKVLHLTFDRIDWREEFDGVWACASLLHLPSPQLQIALDRMIGGLRRGGVFYVQSKRYVCGARPRLSAQRSNSNESAGDSARRRRPPPDGATTGSFQPCLADSTFRHHACSRAVLVTDMSRVRGM
jgi:SAM-dependent methyltransferase